MRRCVLPVLAFSFGALVASAQDVLPDKVGQQASRLEAELGKYRDNAPESAELLSELVSLYHSDGRAFGLVRAGHRFVAAHPQDRRHHDVMLKLIDGLIVLSRNKDLASTSRQFLARYPDSAHCTEVEERLAATLDQMDDRAATAGAYRDVWRRQGETATGRQAGVRAIELYAVAGGKPNIAAAAELAAEMLDHLAPDQFSRLVGWRGFNEWRRISEWAKSNVLGHKLLEKGFAADPLAHQLHWYMAENYRYLGQYANAVTSLRAARSINKSQNIDYYLIENLYNAEATPDQIEPLATEYVTDYPDRPDRFSRLGLLAHSYLRSGNKPRALELIARLLPDDATWNNNASVFVRENGSEPEQLAKSEQLLRSAIANNKRHAYYLRYVLAFEVYRDRVKDLDKCRQVLRELVSEPHGDDHYPRYAGQWLLDQAKEDAVFQEELERLIQDRRNHIHQPRYRNFLADWQKNASRNKQLRSRAQLVKSALAKQNGGQELKPWLSVRWRHDSSEARARDQLLQNRDSLSDQQLRMLLEHQAYYYRRYVSSRHRPKSVELYRQLAARDPQRYDAAAWYLQSATDYGSKEQKRAAAENMLLQKPQRRDADAWRRLMVAADQNQDPELARRSYQWIRQCQRTLGDSNDYASSIGDVLMKLKLEELAVQHWQRYLKQDPKHHETRECAGRLLARIEDDSEKAALVEELFAQDSDYHGRYAGWLAGIHFRSGDWDRFEQVLRESRRRQDQRPYRTWDIDSWQCQSWIDQMRGSKDASSSEKQRVYTIVRDLRLGFPSAAAELALLELAPPPDWTPMQRLLAYQRPTQMLGNEYYDWDRMVPFAQNALKRQDYVVAATLVGGMLANITNAGTDRQKAGRDMISQAYSRMGAVGLTIDENSPLAPLLQAALYLRLGDEDLAFNTYLSHKTLYDSHSNEVPTDLLTFVSERLIAAGGDQNHDYVEQTLRGWLVRHSESEQHPIETKALIQLLLARNYVGAQRYDVARSEFTTCINRYADTNQAIEARFGIGETFMAQKVYDQAEKVFEELANRPETRVVVRAEFLRGVLAFRRGDHDDAREIFRAVLERVPDVALANQALFNLAEVYGFEERYLDQLNLLRTVGRLGAVSKRRHPPGTPLSIVVHDSDLGISRGHSRIKVLVTTEPGGDREVVELTSAGAGKGLFRVDLATTLGAAEPGDQVLQLTGNDIIKSDYPDEFKSEFRSVPISDVEIRVAANAEFEVSSSKIVDEQEETFSERLEREARQRDETDQRVSQGRPINQIKPGNLIYLRVKDGDRDLSDDNDEVVIKLTADSGDQVQATLTETEPHTGIFEGTVQTGELPAGALASDTAIEHSPLMAIDRDIDSAWVSEPDGATPKTLTIDMKDLKPVSRVTISTPDNARSAPVRGVLLGSYDGEFWFRLAGHPELKPAPPLADAPGRMKRSVYNGNYTGYTRWNQVVDLARNGKPFDQSETESDVRWVRDPEAEGSERPFGVIWHGKFVQRREGAMRIRIAGAQTALALDGFLQLDLAPGRRTVDLWLEKGIHEMTIFAAARNGQQPVEAMIARASLDSSDVTLAPFHESDFDFQTADVIDEKSRAVEPQPENIPLMVQAAQLHKVSDQFGLDEKKTSIGWWHDLDDTVKWEFQAGEQGAYDVLVDAAHPGGGGRYSISLGSVAVESVVPNTGSWNKYVKYRAGTVLISSIGAQTITLKPLELRSGALMNLRGVSLQPASGPRRILHENGWEFRFEPKQLRYIRFAVDEYLGESLAINHVEIGHGAVNHIPTKTDVLALANNDTLEIAGGDLVSATYTDEHTQSESGASRLLSARLTATYFNAGVTPVAYDMLRSPQGGVATRRKELLRVDPGERVVIEIVDYDEDRTNERDTIPVQVQVNDGKPIQIVASETDNFTGIFTKEVDTTASDEQGKLKVKPGDRIYFSYTDTQNTFPGHSVPRETSVFVNQPTRASVRIFESRVEPQLPESTAPPRFSYRPPADDTTLSGLALRAPLTVEVIDPDQAKDSRSSVLVQLETSDGVVVEVQCVISEAFADGLPVHDNPALLAGRFVGQVMMQLGSKDTPQIVPITSEMPRNLIGGPIMETDEGMEIRSLITRVLNLTGKDIVAAQYNDLRRPDDGPVEIASKGRLVVAGTLACTDREYDKPVQALHVGERMFLRVEDADRDVTDLRDEVSVVVTTTRGEKETVELVETLSHSGLFTGSVMLSASENPTAQNIEPDNPAIECYFGGDISLQYLDETTATGDGEGERNLNLPVVIGTNGLVLAFTKTFNDEDLAVETKFHIAESYFELFKSHKELGRDVDQSTDLESGRRVLTEVMEDYPDPKYAPRIAYLLGQFSQELKHWEEAIRSYELIIRQYPDHSLAPDAQYKLAQCYEESGDFDQALEGYVTLAATYPKSPLIANVMIRISDHFYKNERYNVAAKVGEKFLERFEGHQHAPRMAFRVGQCYYKAEGYVDASNAFDRFAKKFPDDELCAQALFWSGESYRLGRNNLLAFQRYNRCRWDFPSSEAAKYARGRLTLPEMLQQFEAAVNSLDQDQ